MIAVQLVGALLVGLQILLARAGIAAVLEQARTGAGDWSAALPPLVGLAIAAALGRVDHEQSD